MFDVYCIMARWACFCAAAAITAAATEEIHLSRPHPTIAWFGVQWGGYGDDSPAPTIATGFRFFDADGNQVWSKGEAYLAFSYTDNETPRPELFKQIDCNGDNVISLSEYSLAGACQGYLGETKAPTTTLAPTLRPAAKVPECKKGVQASGLGMIALPWQSGNVSSHIRGSVQKYEFFAPFYNPQGKVAREEDIVKGYQAFDMDCDGVYSLSDVLAMCDWAIESTDMVFPRGAESCKNELHMIYGTIAITAYDVVQLYQTFFNMGCSVAIRDQNYDFGKMTVVVKEVDTHGEQLFFQYLGANGTNIAFEVFDKDCNGMLTPDETLFAITMLESIIWETEIMAKAGYGVNETALFAAWFHYERDLNKDGVITPTEFGMVFELQYAEQKEDSTLFIVGVSLGSAVLLTCTVFSLTKKATVAKDEDVGAKVKRSFTPEEQRLRRVRTALKEAELLVAEDKPFPFQASIPKDSIDSQFKRLFADSDTPQESIQRRRDSLQLKIAQDEEGGPQEQLSEDDEL